MSDARAFWQESQRKQDAHARALSLAKFRILLDIPREKSRRAYKGWERARWVLWRAIKVARDDGDTERLGELTRLSDAIDYIQRRRNRVKYRLQREDFEASTAEEHACLMRAESVRGLTRQECRARRVCFRCGGPLPSRAQWWCSSACAETWTENHTWSSASYAAMRDAPRTADGRHAKCARCDKRAEEVNHIIPLVGRGYGGGCRHHQSGLEPLCHADHVIETTRQIRERKAGIAPEPVKRPAPVLIAPVVDLRRLSVAQQLRILEPDR